MMEDRRANRARVVVRPRSDISAEEARSLRACAWRFVFQAYYAKKAANRSGQDDGKEIENEFGTITDST